MKIVPKKNGWISKEISQRELKPTNLANQNFFSDQAAIVSS